MKRVLKKGDNLLLMDVDCPANKNIIGTLMVKIGESYGDVIRNLETCIEKSGLKYKEMNVGGFGSVYLFVQKFRN